MPSRRKSGPLLPVVMRDTWPRAERVKIPRLRQEGDGAGVVAPSGQLGTAQQLAPVQHRWSA